MTKFTRRALSVVMLASVPMLLAAEGSSCTPCPTGTWCGPQLVIPAESKCGDGATAEQNNKADKTCEEQHECPEGEVGYCPHDRTMPNGKDENCYTFCVQCACKLQGFTDPSLTDDKWIETMSSPSTW